MISKNISFQYLSWQFIDVPRSIWIAWKNFLLFNLNYFSLSLLVKTFFSPWRKYVWVYPKGLEIGKYFEVLFSNLISRVLGAVVRFFLIIFGLLVEVFIIFAGLFLFLGWLVLPILLIIGLCYGLKLLF